MDGATHKPTIRGVLAAVLGILVGFTVGWQIRDLAGSGAFATALAALAGTAVGVRVFAVIGGNPG
jgi:hypothetical protein